MIIRTLAGRHVPAMKPASFTSTLKNMRRVLHRGFTFIPRHFWSTAVLHWGTDCPNGIPFETRTMEEVNPLFCKALYPSELWTFLKRWPWRKNEYATQWTNPMTWITKKQKMATQYFDLSTLFGFRAPKFRNKFGLNVLLPYHSTRLGCWVVIL